MAELIVMFSFKDNKSINFFVFTKTKPLTLPPLITTVIAWGASIGC